MVKPLVGVDRRRPRRRGGRAAGAEQPTRAWSISCGMNPRPGRPGPVPERPARGGRGPAEQRRRRRRTWSRTAILDNFCWGNCNKPDRMGTFVQAAKGCYDAAMAYGTPFISGKDSLNNEFQTDTGETIAIPADAADLGDERDRRRDACVTADAKEPGNYAVPPGANDRPTGRQPLPAGRGPDHAATTCRRWTWRRTCR